MCTTGSNYAVIVLVRGSGGEFGWLVLVVIILFCAVGGGFIFLLLLLVDGFRGECLCCFYCCL